jgi:hypothetical protein
MYTGDVCQPQWSASRYTSKEAQDLKVKRIAARRRCTEAEVIREAVDRISEPDGDLDRLRTAGLLMDVTGIEPMDKDELEALECELEAWHVSRGKPLGLSQAVLDERQETW